MMIVLDEAKHLLNPANAKVQTRTQYDKPHSTEVASALLNQYPQVQIPALLQSSWIVEIEPI